jgi:3-dehydroquinate synthase
MSQPEPNIVLAGFMGSGKTTVGRLVAARSGRTFVDLDELITRRAGKSIAAILSEDGEQAFRKLEAVVCEEMRRPQSLVVSAGTGAVLNPANRAELAAGGTLVCLDAGVRTVARRLAGQNHRPLLAGPVRPARIAALLSDGIGNCEDVELHVDTAGLSVEAVAERVMALAKGLPEGGYCQPVWSEGRVLYDVLVAEGLLRQAGERLLAAGLPAGRCALVTNPTVGAHYAEPLAVSLRAAGFDPVLFDIPDGEPHKTLATATSLFERFAEARLARSEPVIALGGGVTGDIAGFVAATWLRGVPFVQVPTSLLSMVDASVGGKVGVDLPAGKNLVGAFKQPALVLIDPKTLASLPGAEFRSGLAEVLKSAVVGAPPLFEQLAGDGPPSLTSMIADTVRVKIEIVERDPSEAGDRAWLNLGHTFGHALELYSGYTLRHGEAVALGLIAAAELSAALGYCDPSLVVRIRSVVHRLGLADGYHFDPGRVQELMATDKKRAGRKLRFILPRRIGEVALISDVPEEAVTGALRSICEP